MTTRRGFKNRHDTGRTFIEIFPDAVFQKRHIHRAVSFGNPDAFAKIADRLRRIAPSANTGNRRHSRIVPSVHISLFNQFDHFSFAEDGISQIQPCKFDLLRMAGNFQCVQYPVVQRPVVFEFKRADRMGDPFNGIRKAVGKIVHGINAPLVAGTVMGGMADPVNRGIAHHQI